MAKELIIFDCDGTLVNTEELHARATVELLAEERLKDYDFDTVYTRFMGLQFRKMLEQISQETGYVFPNDMSQRYTSRVAERSEAYFKPLPGVWDFVSQVQKRFKTAVGSNGQRDNVLKSLELAGLKGLFPDQHIVTAIEVVFPKPAPDLFLETAARQSVAPDRTIVLEDSVVGVQAAKAAGMMVLGFTGCHPEEHRDGKILLEAGADEIITSYEGLFYNHPLFA